MVNYSARGCLLPSPWMPLPRMTSNSIRVDAGPFVAAREQGLLMPRSAAQQIEHRARLGAHSGCQGFPWLTLLSFSGAQQREARRRRAGASVNGLLGALSSHPRCLDAASRPCRDGPLRLALSVSSCSVKLFLASELCNPLNQLEQVA